MSVDRGANEERFPAADLVDDCKDLFRDITRQLIRDERQKRKAAFISARKQVERVTRLSVEAHGLTQSYHKRFMDDDLGLIERRVYFSLFNFPGMGNVTRLIVNDEGAAPNFSGQRIAIKDYIIASAANVLTWQESTLHRPEGVHQWKLNPFSGPIIEQRVETVNLPSGSEYNVNFPKLSGWPTPLVRSLINRARLEEATSVMEDLSIDTFQVGYKNDVGF